MSKFNFTKILISIVFVLALVCTMSIITFAEGTDDATEENQLVYNTEYGSFTVSDKYASVTDNPWVSFNMDTGACLRGSNIFAQDGAGILAHSGYSCTNLLVVLRDDYVISSANHPKQWFNAAWHAGRNVVIDLQGNTLTFAHSMGSGLFFCEAKTSGLLNYTFQNGNIIYKTKSTLMTTYPRTNISGLEVRFTMKNINFSVDDSVASSSFVMFATTDSSAGHNVDVKFTFEDSVLDFSNTASTVTLFEMGSAKSNIDYTLTFKGGKIVGDPNRLNTYLGTLFNNIQFRKGSADVYPVVVLPSDAAVPTRYFEDENGKWLGFTAENSVVGEDGNTTYTPVQNTNPLLTPYGVLPDDNALLAVFDINTRTVVYTGNVFTSEDANSALGYVARKSGTFAIYVRQDIPTSAFTGTVWDIFVAGNNILIDLNGHTLTLGANTLFRTQVKSSSMFQYIRVFNGTINNNGRKIVDVGAVTGSDGQDKKNATINLVFTNVDFIIKDAPIVSDTVDKDHPNTFNITFNDCAFNVQKGYENTLFDLGNFSISVINITVNGGSFTFADASAPSLTELNGKTNVSFKLSVGSDGKYPTIFTGETGEKEYVTDAATPYGVYVFVNSASADGISTWLIYEKTQYGYIDEEHMDRSAYPMVMFIEGAPFDTWYPNNYGNETAGTVLQEYFRAYRTYTNKNSTLLVRKNYTFSGTLNHWTTTCNFTIDFGGNTVTLTSSMLFRIDPRAAGTGHILVKNGTLNVNGKNVITHGFRSAYTANITFEDIVFVNPNVIVGATAGGSASPSTNLNFNIVFNNCTVSKSNSSYVFQFAKATNYPNVNIQVNGGSFNFADKYLMFSTANTEKIKLTFGAYNGEYTKVQVGNGTDLSKTIELTADGMPLQFVKDSQVDTKVTYQLTPLAFVSTYLNLTHDINFVYRVCVPAGYTNPVVTFSVGGDTVTVEEYTVDENGLYCFKFTGIAPHKMGDLVTASVTATCGGVQKTIVNDKVSIKNYADALRVEYAEDAEMIALLDNLLVYGAASQVYMNYNLNALVAEIGELSEVEKAPITFTGEKSDIANIAACGLLLDGAFDLRVGIQATSLEGLTLDIKKGDVTTTVTLTEDMIDGEYIVVYYDGLYINELDTEVTFTLKHNGEVVGKALTFSANAYLYRMQTSQNTALANLTKALYAYGVSAKAYNA